MPRAKKIAVEEELKKAFINHISSITELSKEEEELLLSGLVIQEYKKGEVILEEGKTTQESYLIMQGCVRRHRLIDGLDKTTAFYTEGEVVAEFDKLTTNMPTINSYSCVENTFVVVVDSEREKDFYKHMPRFVEVSRLEMEKMLGKAQEELSNFINNSPEERYKNLLETKPELLQRVPQHQIASYLGVTPESLSRIKKRITKS